MPRLPYGILRYTVAEPRRSFLLGGYVSVLGLFYIKFKYYPSGGGESPSGINPPLAVSTKIMEVNERSISSLCALDPLLWKLMIS